MAIDHDKIMSLQTKDQEFSYGDRETMLYALGIGFGRDPLDANELNFVYERNLKTIPTMATVISWGAGNMRESGINYLMVLHGEQRLKLYEPLPTFADILVDSRVVGVIDKGKEKGALILTETDIKHKERTNLSMLNPEDRRMLHEVNFVLHKDVFMDIEVINNTWGSSTFTIEQKHDSMIFIANKH